jgi:VCBS repeat-containing protein
METEPFVATVTAVDPDGAAITFQLDVGADAPRFSLDPNSGRLTFNAPADYEAPADSNADNVYSVTVLAVDEQGARAPQQFNVTVEDRNEPPSTNDQAFVLDGVPAAGTVIGQIDASDPDSGDQLVFTLGGQGSGFAVDSASGVLTVAKQAVEQLQLGQDYTFEVQVADGEGLTTTATVSVRIEGGGQDETPTEAEPPVGELPPVPDPGVPEAQPPPDTAGGTSQAGTSDGSGGVGAAEPGASGGDDPGVPFAGGGPAQTLELEPTIDLSWSDSAFSASGVPGAPAEAALPSPDPAPRPDLRAVFRIVFSDEDGDAEQGIWSDDGLRFREAQIATSLAALTDDGLDTAIDLIETAGERALDNQLVVSQAATAATLSLTAGFVAWTLRSGALVASLFASTPLWLQVDPLPVLAREDDEEEGGSAGWEVGSEALLDHLPGGAPKEARP